MEIDSIQDFNSVEKKRMSAVFFIPQVTTYVANIYPYVPVIVSDPFSNH